MSNEFQSQINESVRESLYARYNSYHCDQCDMYLPMHQVADHVAKKHSGLQFGAHQSSNSDDDADSMANSIGRNVASKSKPTKQLNVGENGIGNQHRGAAAEASTIAPAHVDPVVTQTSGDETDFRPFHDNIVKKRGFLDDDNDGGAVMTSTPYNASQNERSTVRSTARSFNRRLSAAGAQWGDGNEVPPNRRRTIPTAHQLFDYSQNQTEFRASNFSNFGGGGGAVNNGGGDEGRTKRPAYRRRSVSVQRAPVIPENFEACPHCSSIMHQDYVRSHIQRKHSAAAAYDSSVEADTNGINFVTMASNDGDGFPNGNGAANGVGKSKNANEPIFIRCSLCSAHMHINYMPLHLVRRHRTEFDGSAGFIWTQCADSQVNELLSSNRVYVKNGAVYFNDLE